MAGALQPLNLSDFRGGLNLRADAFQLAENESPEMLNVDVDPRGGVRSRRGWTRWNGSAIAGTWSATRLHVWEQPDGSRDVILANNGGLQVAATGTFSTLSDGSGAITVAADVHGADFADWGSTLYIACGRAQVSRKWSGSGNASALTASGPTWQNSYTAPVGGYFPRCDFLTTCQGYMVAASTREDGTDYRNRVRFSHPNSPENWAALDYIDIEAGGAKITGLVAFADHVVVFKTNSVWAIYGNDIDSFAAVNITNTVGAVHRNAVAVAENGAFFYSHPNGVHVYQPGEGVTEVSGQLRPIIDSNELNPNSLSDMFMGYMNRRLWWSVPYEKDAVATSPRAVFVFDPSLGAWTMYRDADGDGLAAFATGGNQGDGALLLAAHAVHGYVVEVDASDDPVDTIDASNVGFPTLYATRWLNAGWPALRKSWRRPDYVFTQAAAAYNVFVSVFRDYDESSARSTHQAVVDSGSTAGVWGVGIWGEGEWGASPSGSIVVRGGSIGLASATQLKFEGEVGKAWSLNAVVMKFRNRRFR